MADRYFTQFQGALEKGVVKLFATITFGATGAPTLTRGKGIASISRTGAGDFKLTLGTASTTDKYQRLLGCSGSLLNATASAAPIVQVKADGSAATGTVDVLFLDAAGVAADPGDGEVALIELTLSNSTAL